MKTPQDPQDELLTTTRRLKARVSELEAQLAHHHQAEKELTERLKELQLINRLSQLTAAEDLSLAEVLHDAVALIPPACQDPEHTCACLHLHGERYQTTPFKKTEWVLSTPMVVNGQPAGRIDVYRTLTTLPQGQDPFLVQEKNLLGWVARNLGQFVERQEKEAELQQIKWMLQGHKSTNETAFVPEYGDLSELHPQGLILSAIGRERLREVAAEYLDLLETSSAIYERNGAYALGIFSSGWCRMMDAASRRLCQTEDNHEALQSGRWLCHESCWQDASLPAIKTGQIMDVACNGGIHLYAVPVLVNGECVGAINFGYGNPPTDEATLHDLARDYQLPVDELRRQARAYQTRPQFIIEYAKTRIQKAALSLGSMIEHAQSVQALQTSEANLRRLKDTLEAQVAEKTTQLQARVEELEAFFDATVDRELRMKELRDQVERLQGQNDSGQGRDERPLR